SETGSKRLMWARAHHRRREAAPASACASVQDVRCAFIACSCARTCDTWSWWSGGTTPSGVMWSTTPGSGCAICDSAPLPSTCCRMSALIGASGAPERTHDCAAWPWPACSNCWRRPPRPPFCWIIDSTICSIGFADCGMFAPDMPPRPPLITWPSTLWSRPSSSPIVVSSCWLREPSGPQVRPALLLLLHQLDDAGGHVADAVQHVALGELGVVHRVLAGIHLHAGAECLVDAPRHRRVHLQHVDSRPVGDDLDRHVGCAQVLLDVLRVVEREV